jgi:nitrite reductase/ring-hydroxylating ferredoxin subunit/uncharacterized membrane protein
LQQLLKHIAMKSRAHLKSHPLHPILITFPIAFYIGTFLFDVLAIAKDEIAFALTGLYIHSAAIVAAIVAAVPGFIDYTYTVPPKSSAKDRATKHGLLNSSVLIIFGIALFLKHRENISPYIVLTLEFVGVVLTLIAGWMGGTLVHRNQIGIDIRYAAAGKWKDEHLDQSSGQLEVCSSDELKVDQMKLIHLKDKRIVIARTEEGYVAFDDRCTHKGGALAGGTMICGTVQCPWHGSQFDVKTGEVKAGPAKEKINTYAVTESAGKVYVNL